MKHPPVTLSDPEPPDDEAAKKRCTVNHSGMHLLNPQITGEQAELTLDTARSSSCGLCLL